MTGRSPLDRWHFRFRGTTTSFGDPLPVLSAGCSQQAAGHELSSVPHASPRSSTARAGTALIVNRVTICGVSYPSTCCLWMTTSANNHFNRLFSFSRFFSHLACGLSGCCRTFSFISGARLLRHADFLNRLGDGPASPRIDLNLSKHRG